MSHADSAENTTVQKEGWNGLIAPLLFMGPSIMVSVEVLVGLFLWPIPQTQCGILDVFCGFGATFDGMAKTLMHYPPIFIQIPLAWFLIVMVGAALVGDH